jgi:hypothetical protein
MRLYVIYFSRIIEYVIEWEWGRSDLPKLPILNSCNYGLYVQDQHTEIHEEDYRKRETSISEHEYNQLKAGFYQ